MEILTTVTVSIAYSALSCYTDVKLFVYQLIYACSFFVSVEIGGDVFETSSKRGYNVGKLLVHNLRGYMSF